MKDKQLNIDFKDMRQTFFEILLREKFGEDDALHCAEIFTSSSLDGIYSHGVNRFARFVEYIRKGYVRVDEKPSLIHSLGNIEQWNGNLGPGPLNAMHAADRCMKLASQSSIGMVTLANTNHWMRGGTYGIHCAEKGYAFIGWTNTIANLPPWGSTQNKLGNNPMVFAVPFAGDVILVDMAISQYSFGKLEDMHTKGAKLPQAGGYNTSGELTNDPGEILESRRALPVGFWKGSALSLLLDILAAVLSGGLSTAEISQDGREEYSVSQVYICIDLKKLPNFPAIEHTIGEIIRDYLSAAPTSPESVIRYPGQNRKRIREANMASGIPVDPKVWAKICTL
ncbi:3-dehydro-L-gulonate 2-dehydrogenase [Mangrovibacterium sp.]|uniref:3-dehydro-L-gulonate 2-dehydrogenase n=1 Tax=Mangrovibacterium sp. TaxID=1961364 RepID=UPI0035697EBA